jgi:hypothetical protein
LNILIALYNSAYEDISGNATDEYMAIFAQKTMQFVRAPDENVFIPREFSSDLLTDEEYPLIASQLSTLLRSCSWWLRSSGGSRRMAMPSSMTLSWA